MASSRFESPDVCNNSISWCWLGQGSNLRVVFPKLCMASLRFESADLRPNFVF